MRLLIIEDDEQTLDLLRQGLTEAGFSVDVCSDGLKGLAQAITQPYDAIILDIMLPTMDGWMILASLRERDRHTPTLVLSATDSVAGRVRGLTLGADDYLVKPFAFDELVARIRALLRRHDHADIVAAPHSDEIELDPRRLAAKREGVSILMSSKEYELLELMVQHRGETLSRKFIMEKVWHMDLDSDSNVIEVYIGRLRKKIDDPFDRKLIRTVRGRGYVFG